MKKCVYFLVCAVFTFGCYSSSGQIINTIAGDGTAGFGGDAIPATTSQLNNPYGVAVDASGNCYVADNTNNRIRKITPAGIITTIAGTGAIGYTGDGSAAISAKMNTPTGVAADAAGNVYIADYANNKIRKVNVSGIISTVAGVGLPAFGYGGDGGPAIAAHLYYPMTVATDVPGNVYICDRNNNCIRKITTATGIINTIAGNDTAGFSGDGGPAIHAKLDQSTGVAVRNNGDVYICDNNNNRIRLIKITDHPFFTNGHIQNFLFCPTELLSIDTLLRVNDIDVGQTETWSVVQNAVHGTLVAAYSALSTGGTITPTGLTYAPVPGYTGPDSFKVQVFDGTSYDTTTVYVTVVGFPNAGTITGIDSVCPGFTSSLADVVTGGVWNSSNISFATVSAVGIVTGVAPGAATITYTVTNQCGSAIAVLPFRVIASVPCISEIYQQAHSETNIRLSPNPGNGSFSVFIPSAAQGEMRAIITDVLGHKLKEYILEANKNVEILVDLPSGVYMFTADNANGKLSAKMSIVK